MNKANRERRANVLRVKKLDVKRALPVYFAADIPDLDEAASQQRTVPWIETGVDKEEEVEHHLQAAISAAQSVNSSDAIPLYIPTPDASKLIANYVELYKHAGNHPTNLLRFSSTVEDCVGNPYSMDEQDEKWLVEYNSQEENSTQLSEDAFETIMSTFEKYMAEKELHDSIPPFDDFSFSGPLDQLKIPAHVVYDYWKSRRLERGGKPIMPSLKFEELVTNEADPYICFRRREVKTLRKTRRTDALSLDKLKKLRAEMDTARILLEQVAKREKMRKESLILEHLIFDQRCVVRDIKRRLGLKDDVIEVGGGMPPPLFRKKKGKESAGSITIPLLRLSRTDGYEGKGGEGNRPSAGPKASPYDAVIAKRREWDAPYEDVTFTSYEPVQEFSSHGYHRPTLPDVPPRNVRPPAGRQRVGRGGRLFFDRRGYRWPMMNVPSKWRYDDDCSEEEFDLEDDGSRWGRGKTGCVPKGILC